MYGCLFFAFAEGDRDGGNVYLEKRLIYYLYRTKDNGWRQSTNMKVSNPIFY